VFSVDISLAFLHFRDVDLANAKAKPDNSRTVIEFRSFHQVLQKTVLVEIILR
jgi:hypothetical protein